MVEMGSVNCRLATSDENQRNKRLLFTASSRSPANQRSCAHTVLGGMNDDICGLRPVMVDVVCFAGLPHEGETD